MIILDENEKIYLVKRRHPIILKLELLPEVLIFLLTAILIISLFFIHFPSWPEWLIKIFPSLLKFEARYLLLFFLSLSLLIFWQIIFLVITNYYLDCWIVTNKRTIHIELKSLFNRTESSVPHDKIQDITIDTKGILPTFFNFGDLYIETAGEFRQFVFRQIPDPEKTKEAIFDAQREFLKTLKKDGIL
jgi:uncharacterized membrane protein YdbT with pleckstrin-like domain